MAQFPELVPGLSGTIQHRVNEKSTARQLGSGTVDVLATPELVRLMEVAAVAALSGSLPSEFTSVGVAINVKHIAPTPVGLNVKVHAALTNVQGRYLTFQVVAHDAAEEIGRGTHERVLVEVDNFMARANRKLHQSA
jgi:fluoroacetyl-CoA thioesterase